MSIGIYKITSPSNKIYIGQSINIERRIKQYKLLKEIKKCKKIYFSIKKYGYKNHKFEVVEYCCKEKLNEREIYWIDFYDSVNKGLNISYGGNSVGSVNKGKKRSKKTKQKISKTKKLNPRKYTQEMIKTLRDSSTTSKKVYQYDLKGNFIKEYPSINEAARQMNVKNDGISACLRKKQNTAYGYQWFYTLQDNVNEMDARKKPDTWVGNRNVDIDNKVNEIIKLYLEGNNVTQIAKMFNVHRDVIKIRLKEKKIN
jgi:hypothetical protein